MLDNNLSWLVIDTTHTGGADPAHPHIVGVMRVSGEVDLGTRTAFTGGLEQVLARDPRRMMLDCSALAFCGAAGLGALMHTVALGAERGTDVAVIGLSPLLLRLCAELWPGPQPLPYRTVTDAVTAVAAVAAAVAAVAASPVVPA